MAYAPIDIDRKALTIMGIPFPDKESLENVASAVGSNMFEGFVPTPRIIELLRDYVEGKVSRAALAAFIKDRL